MSIKHKLNRSLGLENIADVPVADNDAFDDVGAVVDAVMPDGTPTPEADVVELEIVYDEAFTSGEDLAELVEAAQSIEVVRETMSDAHANGGLTPESARYAEVALEAIGIRYRATANEMGMVSLESFGDNRVQATTVSMEGVVDTLKSWWATIVQKFKDMIQKINKYYQESWSGAARLKKRAEGLKAKSRKVEGVIDNKTFDDKALFNGLNIAGAEPTASSVTDGLKRAGVAAKSPVTPDTLETKLDGILKLTNTGNVELSGIMTLAKQLVSYSASGSGGKLKIHGSSPLATVSSITGLPGNQAIVWGVTKSAGDAPGAKILQSYQFRVVAEDASLKSSSSAKKVPALSLTECENMCDVIIDNMANIIRNKSDSSKSLKLADNIKSKGDTFIKGLDDDITTEARQNATHLMVGVTHIGTEIQQGNAAVLRYNMRVSKTALSWVARSLSNFKKK